jgi:hypothetical protein
MISIIITDLDDSYYELRQEFEKLALLIPTIPQDQCLSQLEFIEFVIAHIQQLQQELLSYDQWNEHIIKLASSGKHSLLPTISPYLFNQNESSPTIHRSPLATINPDNTRLS